MTDGKDKPGAEEQAKTKEMRLPEYDPKTDPNSPLFDREAWTEAAIEADPTLKAAIESIADKLTTPLAKEAAKTADQLQQIILGPSFSEALETVQSRISGILDTVTQQSSVISQILNSDKWKETQSKIRYIADNAETLKAFFDEQERLKAYLLEELKKPEYKGLSLEDLTGAPLTDKDGNPTEYALLFEKALTAARAAMKKEQERPLPQVTAKRAENIEYPLDKVNAAVWNLLEQDTQGQITFAMERRRSKKPLNLYYSIDFDALGNEVAISRHLTPFDKRVYTAISALFNAGNTVISLTQIHFAMGNITRPKTAQLKKINDAITKMTGARISVDNSQEAQAYNYDKFIYEGALLPLERGLALVNGQLADAAIHIFREPPLISFAKQRGQITTVNIKLLQSPFNKTDANLLIEDYLIERIARAKKTRKPEKILFKTLFDKADIKTKKQKERAPEKIEGYLKHQQQEGFFRRFEIDKDGITIYF